MRFKRIYVEITNRCNLNCSFCSLDNRKLREMSVEEFEFVIRKIRDYTDYIYLHVKGEPLIHSRFSDILDICKRYNIKVNITTNGVFLDKRIKSIIDSGVVRQINISLHSENNKINYIGDILDSVGNIKDIIINYRFWTLEDNKLDDRMSIILDKIYKYYGVIGDSSKINNNTFISRGDKFVWPDIENDYYYESGYCLGMKSQIGILSDGTVVVCCLDSKGISNLGNIFNQDMDSIINSEKALKIIDGFNNRCVYLELCKHCSYKERFDK